jgi:protease-4
MKEKPKKRWVFVIITLAVFAFAGFFLSSILSFFITIEPSGNIAVIPVKGTLTVDGGSTFGEELASSTEIIEQIQKAEQEPSIKAILFDINSPGGSAVASKEIADAIKRTNKTAVAVIREVGASGGYWVASATDYIISNEMSITGSIGVFSSYIEFAGLLNRYNMTYQRLTAGKYKDIGDPFKPLAQDERDVLQQKINKIHDFFIKAIAENRKIPEEKVRQLATGEFFLGSEALELGLIDKIGDKETAKQYLQQKLNLSYVEFAEFRKPKSIFDILSSISSEFSFLMGKGIGSELKEVNKFEIIT